MNYIDPLEDYVSSIMAENLENPSIVPIRTGEVEGSIFGMSEEKEEEIFFTQFLN